MEANLDEIFPYRIEVYLTAEATEPDHTGASADLTFEEACQQSKIILRRFMAHHVRQVPIIVAGRWYRKSADEVKEIGDRLTKTFCVDDL